MSKPISNRLSQTSLLVLLSLSLKPRHGYELLQQIHEDTKGTVTLEAGTLYGALKPLRQHNLIEEIPFGDNPRRRQYRLTRKGWDTLADELGYYRRIIAIAEERQLI